MFFSKSLKGRILVLGVLPFLFVRSPSAIPVVPQFPSNYWHEAADFLILEEDKEGLQKLQEKFLRDRAYDVDLAVKFIDYRLKAHDRKNLIEFMSKLAEGLHCDAHPEKNLRAVCDQLASLWVDNLDAVLFFEESSGKIEQSRRLLAAKDCPSALRVLKEVESKEGASKTVLVMLGQTFDCLADVEAAAKNAERLREIRIFASATDS